MIYVVSGWVEYRYTSHQTGKKFWTIREMFDWQHNREPELYACHSGIFRLDAGRTKVPVWRLEKKLTQDVAVSRLQCDFQLEAIKKERQADFTIRVSDFPWVDGIHPNKSIDKGDIVALFPECKEMPRPYCLDYITDRA